LKTVNYQFIHILLFFAFGIHWLQGQVAPSEGLHDNTPRVFVLKGATIIPEPGKILPTGEIVIRDGLIESVGEVAKIPQDAFEIDLTGKTIYAGFIESYLVRREKTGPEQKQASYGAGKNQESRAMEGKTVTESWNPRIRPDFSALYLFKPEESEKKSLRALGFTTAHLIPESGIFKGRSTLIHLGDWSPKSVINEKGPTQILAFEYGGSGDRSYPNSLLGCIALIRQTFIDTEWYKESWKTYYRYPDNNEQPEVDRALEALGDFLNQKGIICFEVSDELDALRAGKIAREFDLDFWIRGNGYEYRRLLEIGDLKTFVILPLNFPGKPDIETWESTLQYTHAQLRHWDQAPDNPQRLKLADIPFALTSSELKNRSLFRNNLTRSIQRGFSEEDALASLTTIPAKYLGMENTLGTIEEGKIANLVVTDGNYFEKNTNVLELWIQGKRYSLIIEPVEDIRGKWVFHWEFEETTRRDTLNISGKKVNPIGKLIADSIETDLKSFNFFYNNTISFLVEGEPFDLPGIVQFSGTAKRKSIEGQGRIPNGQPFHWFAQLISPFEPPEKDNESTKQEQPSELLPYFPEGAFGFESLPDLPSIILVKNATIWTMGPDGILKDSDLLVKRGKIWKTGKNLSISGSIEDAVIIDAKGKHITPGIIDAHSHSASAAVNEGTQAVTAEVRMEDVLDSDDINIYRELAGGLTIANILHGSANPIGGQNAVIKLRWGSTPDEMLYKAATKGIKFALGENVKQSNWGESSSTRYPQTRMGVEQIIRDAFTAAIDYQREWNNFRSRKTQSLKKIPPRRDLEFETLIEILEGERKIHCHAYRQDEILMLIRVAEDFGFQIGVFQHVLEGYKIAEAIQKHGAGASAFTDWWAYKFEVFDAIPYNGVLMQKVGVLTTYNSDSSELARRLNTEAAKAMKYGGLSEEEALKFVTINSATQLGIDKWVGSLEVDKDADFVIWSGNPLSTYSVCEQTWIDGKKYFDIVRDSQMRKEMEDERNRLNQKILSFEENSIVEKMKGESSKYSPGHPYSCLDGVVRITEE